MGYVLDGVLVSISTHAPRTGSDRISEKSSLLSIYFNPRSPHGERHFVTFLCACDKSHFNPRSPHGERHGKEPKRYTDGVFQPTLPARGATAQFLRAAAVPIHFNPRSPHGERQFVIPVFCPFYYFNPRSPHGERRRGAAQSCVPQRISTHAPRTGSDPRHGDGARVPRHISTHAPRTGSDLVNSYGI